MRILSLACLLFLAASCADPDIESTTLLEETTNTRGPYEIHTVIQSAQPGDKVELFYNAVDITPAHFIPLRMEPQGSDGQAADLFVGQIPGQPAGTTILYYIAVERDGSRVSEDPVGGDLRPYALLVTP